jgi:hypothetical protein
LLSILQKLVDMKIGLDAAWLLSNKKSGLLKTKRLPGLLLVWNDLPARAGPRAC